MRTWRSILPWLVPPLSSLFLATLGLITGEALLGLLGLSHLTSIQMAAHPKSGMKYLFHITSAIICCVPMFSSVAINSLERSGSLIDAFTIADLCPMFVAGSISILTVILLRFFFDIAVFSVCSPMCNKNGHFRLFDLFLLAAFTAICIAATRHVHHEKLEYEMTSSTESFELIYFTLLLMPFTTCLQFVFLAIPRFTTRIMFRTFVLLAAYLGSSVALTLTHAFLFSSLAFGTREFGSLLEFDFGCLLAALILVMSLFAFGAGLRI